MLYWRASWNLQAKPVVIEDDVLIGANAVILEGVVCWKRCCCSCWFSGNQRCRQELLLLVLLQSYQNTSDLDKNKNELLDDLRK